ncbi:Hippocampus abundant transcript 1 protein [Larimichthys crocea]|nr:Hippocampus abundant transcript 1 protein [Larimichthys crocea]
MNPGKSATEAGDIMLVRSSHGRGRARVTHAVVVIFLEFFAWGLLTTPMLTVSATFAASLVTSPAIGAYLSAQYSDSLVVLVATVIAVADIAFVFFVVPESLPDKMRLTSWGFPISWEQADPFAVIEFSPAAIAAFIAMVGILSIVAQHHRLADIKTCSAHKSSSATSAAHAQNANSLATPTSDAEDIEPLLQDSSM